jgi:hypothetical protein
MAGTKDAKRAEYRLLKLMNEGKLLQSSVPEDRAGMLTAVGLSRATLRHIRELEQRGIIVGYVPVLSERGHEYFNGLKAVYGSEPETEPVADNSHEGQ